LSQGQINAASKRTIWRMGILAPGRFDDTSALQIERQKGGNDGHLDPRSERLSLAAHGGARAG